MNSGVDGSSFVVWYILVSRLRLEFGWITPAWSGTTLIGFGVWLALTTSDTTHDNVAQPSVHDRSPSSSASSSFDWTNNRDGRSACWVTGARVSRCLPYGLRPVPTVPLAWPLWLYLDTLWLWLRRPGLDAPPLPSLSRTPTVLPLSDAPQSCSDALQPCPRWPLPLPDTQRPLIHYIRKSNMLSGWVCSVWEWSGMNTTLPPLPVALLPSLLLYPLPTLTKWKEERERKQPMAENIISKGWTHT
jgi:hypothetical protein